MKKKIAVIVVAVVLCVAAAVFAVPKISFYACEPTVYFDVEYCDKVDAKMSAEDAETVKKMFEGKSAYFDSPSCGFSEKASIRIGCNTYMPAVTVMKLLSADLCILAFQKAKITNFARL